MKILKILRNILRFLLTFLLLIFSIIGVMGIESSIASITGNYSYLNNLNLTMDEVNSFKEASVPINGIIAILMIVFGVLIIYFLNRNVKYNYIISSGLIALYGILNFVNNLFGQNNGNQEFIYSCLIIVTGLIYFFINQKIERNFVNDGKTNQE